MQFNGAINSGLSSNPIGSGSGPASVSSATTKKTHLNRNQSSIRDNKFIIPQNNINNFESKIEIDLNVFGRRLSHKLEKALNIVRELKDFFQMNITRIIHFMDDYDDDERSEDRNHHSESKNHDDTNDDDSDDNDNDEEDQDQDQDIPLEADFWPDFDNDMENPSLSTLNNLAYPCLDSYIDSCYGIENNTRQATKHPSNTNNNNNNNKGENYNHQRIQIINYDKIDQQQHHQHIGHGIENGLLSDAAAGSKSVLNTYIQIKINSLKIQQQSSAGTIMTSSASSSAASKEEWIRSKCLRSHLKHIYFISSGHCNSNSYQQEHYHFNHQDYHSYSHVPAHFYQDKHFPLLYVSAIERKYTFIMLDIGSDISNELWELSKTYGKHSILL